MAKFVRCKIDEGGRNVVISAKSSRSQEIEGSPFHYKFTKIYIDSSCTFNCMNEPSSSATVIDLPEELKVMDGNIYNFKIPFDDILVEDVPNEMLFIFLQEEKYIENIVYDENEYTQKIINYSIYAGWGDPSDPENTYAKSRIDKGIEDKLFDISDVYTHSSTYELCDFVYSCYILFSLKHLTDIVFSQLSIQDEKESCNITASDVNAMLAWQGFELASCCCDVWEMIKYWNYIKDMQGVSINSNCKCHG